MKNAGGLAVGLAVCLVVAIALVAAGLTSYSRRKEELRKKEIANEEGPKIVVPCSPTSPSKKKHRPPELPLYKTRQSLSRSPGSTPTDIVTPGIRFTITSPSYLSKRSASIDSAVSMETVLERQEQDLDAAQARDKILIHDKALPQKPLPEMPLSDGSGEPGPAVMENNEDNETVYTINCTNHADSDAACVAADSKDASGQIPVLVSRHGGTTNSENRTSK